MAYDDVTDSAPAGNWPQVRSGPLVVGGILIGIGAVVAMAGLAVAGTHLAAAVAELRQGGVRFRNDVVTGVGGKQIIAEDPSGNPVELFEPTAPEARLSPGR